MLTVSELQDMLDKFPPDTIIDSVIGVSDLLDEETGERYLEIVTSVIEDTVIYFN